VLGNAEGKAVSSPRKAWATLVLRAHGIKPTWEPGKHRLTAEARAHLKAINLHFHDLRHEAGSRWLEKARFRCTTSSRCSGTRT
jgi:hypothetical protein